MPDHDPAATRVPGRPPALPPDPPAPLGSAGPFVRFVQAVETIGRDTYFVVDTPLQITLGAQKFETTLLRVQRSKQALQLALEQAFNGRTAVKLWVTRSFNTQPGNRRSVTVLQIVRMPPPP
jgi:hypothetical protein